jgi:hypothetical protein
MRPTVATRTRARPGALDHTGSARAYISQKGAGAYSFQFWRIQVNMLLASVRGP